MKGISWRRDDDLSVGVGIRIAVDVVLALRVCRLEQIHRVADLRERLGALLGLFLARRNVRDAHERPLVAEALDWLISFKTPSV